MATNNGGPTIEYIEPREIKIDGTYNRDLNLRHAVKMQKELKADSVKIEVNIRDDRTISCFSGQHRLRAWVGKYGDQKPIRCIVWRGLSIAEETDRYRIANIKLNPRAYDDLKINRRQDCEVTLTTDDILRKYGFAWGPRFTAETLTTPKNLSALKKHANWKEAFNGTISTLNECYKNQKGLTATCVWKTIFLFLVKYMSMPGFDMKAFRKRMATVTAEWLYKTLSKVSNGARVDVIADVCGKGFMSKIS